MPAAALQQLTSLVAPHLAAVNDLFSAELRSDLSHVNTLVSHVAKFRGKMLRPTLVILAGLATSAKPSGTKDQAPAPTGHWTLDTGNSPVSPLNRSHLTLATVVEMVHMATLVHDDILDSADVRRSGATINHLHGNEAAVLLGDYLISHAYHLASSLESQAYARIIAHTTNVVCEGELTQNFNRNNWDLTEKTYYDIIYRKTAILTETCCRLGAMVSTADPAAVEALATYGKKIGLAFQIIDDILDITGNQRTVGKSLGSDIEKGKLTLPMIHFLKHAAPQHRDLLVGLLESTDHDRIERVRQLLTPSSSIAFARHAAETLITQAIGALAILPPSEARTILTSMAHFVTARDR